jgi:polysaccharide export outer membrane protein
MMVWLDLSRTGEDRVTFSRFFGHRFMNCRLIFACFLGFAAAVVPGALCAEDAAPAKDALPATRPDYTLQASDLIKVQVFQEPDLDRDVRLSQEYTVTLPLIGTINLKGMTVREAGELIRDLYNRDYLVNPQVSVIVLEYAARTVNVLGAVNKPGAVDFPPEQPMTFLDAIAKAGGFSRLADRSKVKLTRALPDGKAEMHLIDADEIIQGHAKDTLFLQKDDMIYVPERLF